MSSNDGYSSAKIGVKKESIPFGEWRDLASAKVLAERLSELSANGVITQLREKSEIRSNVREVPEDARLLSVESIDFHQTAALFTQGGEKIEIGEKIEGKKLTFKFSEARRDDKFAADVGQAFLKEFGAVLEKNGIRIAGGAPNRVKISIAYAAPINDADMRYLVAQVSVFRESMLIFQKPFLLTARRTAPGEVEHEALGGRQLAVSSGNRLAKIVADYFRGDEK